MSAAQTCSRSTERTESGHWGPRGPEHNLKHVLGSEPEALKTVNPWGPTAPESMSGQVLASFGIWVEREKNGPTCMFELMCEAPKPATLNPKS